MDDEAGFGVLLRNHSFVTDEGNCQIIMQLSGGRILPIQTVAVNFWMYFLCDEASNGKNKMAFLGRCDGKRCESSCVSQVQQVGPGNIA